MYAGRSSILLLKFLLHVSTVLAVSINNDSAPLRRDVARHPVPHGEVRPTVAADCGPDTLTNYTDTFSSPNHPASYPAYSSCSWLITSPENNGVVMLDFSTFYIGSADDVYVFDGSSSDANLLRFYYGLINPPPPTVFSTQSDMFVVFDSNYNYSYPGFKGFYSADTACLNPRALHEVSGTFNSPYYPETFTRNKRCHWSLELQPGETAYVYFTYFNVGQRQSNGSCLYAYIELYDQSGVVVDRYCGPSSPFDELYLNTSSSFIFFSDSSQPTPGQGFEAVYYSSRTPSTTTTTTPTTTETTIPPTTTPLPTTTTTLPSTTTPLTSTTPPTPVAPEIQPDPFVRVKLNGTLVAADAMVTLDCADTYSQEFETSLGVMIQQMVTDIDRGLLCVGDNVFTLATGSITFVAVDRTIHLSYNVIVYPSDSSPVRSVELCAYEVLAYLQNYANWRQPIMLPVYGCPLVDFSPTRFDELSVKWTCS